MIADVLRSQNYAVVETSTALQAMEWGRRQEPISLFITDMELHEGRGGDVALKLVALNPKVPVLVMS
jgi:DNA-binding NtrC family response regulator